MREAQDAWVERVLGFRFGAETAPVDDPAATLATLREGMFEAAASIRSLGPSAAGQAFTRQLAAVRDLYKAGNGAAGLASLAALNERLAGSLSSARGADAQAAGQGSVARAKVMLELRAAHAAAQENLRSLGDRVLTLAEVQADPRYGKAKTVLGKLPELLPALDGALTAALDRYDSATDDAGRAAAALDASALLGTYRAMLDGNPTLLRLDEFAEQEFGGVQLSQALRATVATVAAALNG